MRYLTDLELATEIFRIRWKIFDAQQEGKPTRFLRYKYTRLKNEHERRKIFK